jgi:hypothetical protein
LYRNALTSPAAPSADVLAKDASPQWLSQPGYTSDDVCARQPDGLMASSAWKMPTAPAHVGRAIHVAGGVNDMERAQLRATSLVSA